MELSLVQLNNYVVTKIHIDTNPNWSNKIKTKKNNTLLPKLVDMNGVSVEQRIGLSDVNTEAITKLSTKNKKPDDELFKFALHYELHLNQGDSQSFPYIISIGLSSFFVVSKNIASEIPYEEIKEQVHRNGVGVLYSICREQILNLTSRMTLGQVILPMIVPKIRPINEKTS